MSARSRLLRAEYRYSDFGTQANTYLVVPADAFPANLKTKMNIARVGIAYNFGGL